MHKVIDSSSFYFNNNEAIDNFILLAQPFGET